MSEKKEYILIIGCPHISDYPLMNSDFNSWNHLSEILDLILRDIKFNKLREYDYERFDKLLMDNLSDSILMELICLVDDQSNYTEKLWGSFKEYLFHVANETDNFKLIHNASAIYFIDLKSIRGCIVVNCENIPHNEMNVLLGI